MSYENSVEKRFGQIRDQFGVARSLKALQELEAKARALRPDVDRMTLQKRGSCWPTISRKGGAGQIADDGRYFGPSVDRDEQWAMDRQYWIVGKEVREECLPLIVAEDGVVVRAWDVHEWFLEEDGDTKWTAELGEQLDNEALERLGSPLLIGDGLAPRWPRSAYAPMIVDLDGTVYYDGSVFKEKE